MEKYFCSYEQALVLKELGFDEECFGYYLLNTLFISNDIVYNSTDVPAIKAPLKAQVFEWFRNNHQLFYTIETNCSQHSFEWGFDYTIYDKEKDKWLSTEPQNCPPGETTYEIYEEAESACVNKLIEMVKNKL